MNNSRRKDLRKVAQQLNLASEKIKDAVAILENAKGDIEMVADDEQMSYDNLPESLQDTERGEKMLDNVEEITELADRLDELKDDIESFVSAHKER